LFCQIISKKSGLYQAEVLSSRPDRPAPVPKRPIAARQTEAIPMIKTISAALALMLVSAPLAHAEDGAWKVGQSYVIRFENLDLSTPSDRQTLLKQVERSAKKLCEPAPRSRRGACATSAIKATLDQSPAEVRSAVQLARVEREGVLQASR
jgi:UrcA family protein